LKNNFNKLANAQAKQCDSFNTLKPDSLPVWILIFEHLHYSHVQIVSHR